MRFLAEPLASLPEVELPEEVRHRGVDEHAESTRECGGLARSPGIEKCEALPRAD